MRLFINPITAKKIQISTCRCNSGMPSTNWYEPAVFNNKLVEQHLAAVSLNTNLLNCFDHEAVEPHARSSGRSPQCTDIAWMGHDDALASFALISPLTQENTP